MDELSNDSLPSQLSGNNTQESVSSVGLLQYDDSTQESASSILSNYDDSTQESVSPIVPSQYSPSQREVINRLYESVGSLNEANGPSVSGIGGETTVGWSQYIEVYDNECENHAEEPPAKVSQINFPNSYELHARTCAICLDTNNSGEHGLVALKCGHLFGSLCVEKWFKTQKVIERSCPTCNSRLNMDDLRCIYIRRLVAGDTSRIIYLQKQVETLQTEKSKAELDLHKRKIADRAHVLDLEVMRSRVMRSQVMKEQPVCKSWCFGLEKNLEICKDGSCRVMTYNCRTNELYVTQKSYNNSFPGYGIRNVSCVDYKLGQFLHLHKELIRDIKYSQSRDLVLSVGFDKTARIVERDIPNVTVNTERPLWSCSWDYLRSNEFYIGSAGGIILQYDVRN